MVNQYPITAKPPTMTQLLRQLLLGLGLSALCLVALWLWMSWQTSKNLQLQRMTTMATLLAEHSNGYFEIVDHHMGRLVNDLGRANALDHPEQALRLLRQFINANPGLGSAALIRPDGQVTAKLWYPPCLHLAKRCLMSSPIRNGTKTLRIISFPRA